MFKEIIICIIIIITIFIGNNITQKYTDNSVSEMESKLDKVREEMLKEDKSKEEINKKMKETREQWDNRYEKLAYFIEHDELEKVETNLVSLESFIETEEYNVGISELDKCIFILKHIKDKNSFNIMNIF